MKKNTTHSLLTALFFLFLLPTLSYAATVKGRVWHDQNTNGIQDNGEPNLSGIWVLLETPNGMQVDGMLSSSTGAYEFSNVGAGMYHVRFANPGGNWFFTPENVGNDNKDSDASRQTGKTEDFAISGSQSATYDAGFTNTPNGCFTPVVATVSNVLCDNNGTPCNAADDKFTFQVTATGGTGPWGWDIPSMNIFMHPYGTPRTFGPYPVSGGPVTLTLMDHDNNDCTATVTVNPPSCAPPPGVLTMTCPADITVYTDPGSATWKAIIPQPTTSTTCPGGTVVVTQTGGPAANSQVAPGTYTFSFKATDDCCNEKTCSYKITVRIPCDTKINCGIIFDLLDVQPRTNNSSAPHEYCIRVTNNTSAALMYVAFQLPDGVVADAPANGSTYTAPSGRTYEVRNPNFSPFYSIRFKVPNGDGIKSGQSDIFCYKLPPQVNPWYIHAIARTQPKVFCETHLTTVDCMPNLTNPNNSDEAFTAEPTNDDNEQIRTEERDRNPSKDLYIYPNPADDFVMLDLTTWEGKNTIISLFNAQGQLVNSITTEAPSELMQFSLRNVPGGVYQLRVQVVGEQPLTRRVVVQH